MKEIVSSEILSIIQVVKVPSKHSYILFIQIQGNRVSKVEKFSQILHPLFSGRINDFPVYKDTKTGISSKEVMDICVGQNVPEEKICSRVPTGITESTVFVVDLEAVQFQDLTVDDNGVYGAHSSPSDLPGLSR